jgi:DNA-binding NarL/FixJ family response regulator
LILFAELDYLTSSNAREFHLSAMGPVDVAILHVHGSSVAQSRDSERDVVSSGNRADLILILTRNEPDQVVMAFGPGIRGYVPSDLPIRQAGEAFRLVSHGGGFVPPCILSLLAQRKPSESVTQGIHPADPLSYGQEPHSMPQSDRDCRSN